MPGTRYAKETTFPANENPISEGGDWSQTADASITPVQTTGGSAYGTQTGTNGTDDASAYVKGGNNGFGLDYEVEATLQINLANLGDGSHEAEILLRWTDDGPFYDTSFGTIRVRGYEIDLPVDGASIHLARYKADTGLFDSPGIGFAPASGDKLRARIEGQRIRVWYNDVLFIDYLDDAPGCYREGNPGIGFFYSQGPSVPGTNTGFGFASVVIRQLGPMPFVPETALQQRMIACSI